MFKYHLEMVYNIHIIYIHIKYYKNKFITIILNFFYVYKRIYVYYYLPKMCKIRETIIKLQNVNAIIFIVTYIIYKANNYTMVFLSIAQYI